jgi:Mg/Co/Ni transporter MgtE
MAPDDAADLLNELDQKRRAPVLDLVPAPQGQKLRALLQYHPSTAGGLMSPDYIAVPRGTSVPAVLERVRAEDRVPPQLLGSIFVIEPDGHFIGTLGLADVLRGGPDLPVEELASLSGTTVPVDADIQDIALLMTDFNLVAVGVTDADGRLVGAISVDDLLETLIPPDWRRRAEASSSA